MSLIDCIIIYMYFGPVASYEINILYLVSCILYLFVRRMKLKLCIHAYDISLCKVFVSLLSLSHYFGCYGNLKFPLTYKTKSGKMHFFENYCSLRPEKW